MGMKIPLMKTSGNLIREDNIIMVAGTSVGGYADMSILEMQNRMLPR